MSRLPILAAVGLVLTLASGIVQGHLSNRWGQPVDLLAAGQRLESFPRAIGSWELAETRELDSRVVKMLQCSGYVYRQYVDTQTGESALVALLLGPAGPISVHTPEICYSSRDYDQVTERTRVAVPEGADSAHEFWRVDFQSRSVAGEVLQTYYGWCTGGRWEAASSPRFAYGGQPLLYKVQLVTTPLASDDATSDPGQSFLKAFVKAFGHFQHEARRE